MIKNRFLLAAAFVLGSSTSGAALADELTMRVVDTGPGLCVVIAAPGDGYMLYDAGYWYGNDCRRAVWDVVPRDQAFDLVVISHSDADHLAQLNEILRDRDADLFLHTGFERDIPNWRQAMEAIGQEVVENGASVISLATHDLEFGTEFEVGDANVQFVAGWHEWDEEGLNTSELRNVISIVVRVDYAGRSILLPGDSVGREKDDDDDACRYAQQAIVENAHQVPIAADVIVAAHHGSEGSDPTCFIEAVDPTYVIFSAGHDHGHPRAATARRYIDQGVDPMNMFRTDRGDDERPDEHGEWSGQRIDGCQDLTGQDDVEVVISSAGELTVGYRGPNGPCAD